MRKLFFVVNQDIFELSAHSFYCVRNCWWLARTAPDHLVILLFPGYRDGYSVLPLLGLKRLGNFSLIAVPSLRKKKGKPGITVNSVYYYFLVWRLHRILQKNDFIISASFPKLFRFLLKQEFIRDRAISVYEVHQLNILEKKKKKAEISDEFSLLADVNCLITTTLPLKEILQRNLPHHSIYALFLACGFSPENFPDPPLMRDRAMGRLTSQGSRSFTLGYVGSVYPEQGVEWLLSVWKDVRADLRCDISLEIVGGKAAELGRLQAIRERESLKGVTLHGFIPPDNLDGILRYVDAMIIPSLPLGRMPYVAITKTYDYLGMKRPIVAANLPSIQEVVIDGETGVLFEPMNKSSLVAALETLIFDEALQIKLVRNLTTMASKFSWENRAKNYWQIINQICC